MDSFCIDGKYTLVYSAQFIQYNSIHSLFIESNQFNQLNPLNPLNPFNSIKSFNPFNPFIHSIK